MHRSGWKSIEFEAEKLSQSAPTPEERKAWARVAASIQDARFVERVPKAKNPLQRFALYLGKIAGVW